MSKNKSKPGPGVWTISRDEWKRGQKPKWKKLKVKPVGVVIGTIEAIEPGKKKGIKGEIDIGSKRENTHITFSLRGGKKGSLVIEIAVQSNPRTKKK